MKEYLEKTLRQNVLMDETEYLNDKLPLAFQGRYTFLWSKQMDYHGLQFNPNVM